MSLDNRKTRTALAIIISISWERYMIDFIKTYEVQIQSQDMLEPWIKSCEDNGWTMHPFYHLMVLKQALIEEGVLVG